MRRIVIAWLCGVGLLAAACASSGGQPAAGPGSARVSVGQADNGRQITVRQHSTVVVRLASTYWRFAQSEATGALRRVRIDTQPAVHGGVPGSGRGAVVATYRAVSAGTAVVAATRTSCGEALRCPPGQTRFRVTVVVH